MNAFSPLVKWVVSLSAIRTSGQALLLRHWYEIMALYYVKSVLTEIAASRQDRRVLQKKQSHQNQISEPMGHATDVWIRLEI